MLSHNYQVCCLPFPLSSPSPLSPFPLLSPFPPPSPSSFPFPFLFPSPIHLSTFFLSLSLSLPCFSSLSSKVPFFRLPLFLLLLFLSLLFPRFIPYFLLRPCSSTASYPSPCRFPSLSYFPP